MPTPDVFDHLIGRSEDLTRLWQLLDGRSVLMVGPRRIGKTELMTTMEAHPAPDWRVVLVDLEGLTDVTGMVDRVTAAFAHRDLGPSSVKDLLTRIEELGVAGFSLSLGSTAAPDPWVILEGAVLHALSQLEERERLVLMFDELPWWLDSLTETEGASVARTALARLRSLRQSPRARGELRMLLTGSMGLAGLARQLDASAEINDVFEFELGPLPWEAGAALFEREVLEQRGLIATPEAVGRLLGPRSREIFDDEARVHLRKRHGTLAEVMRSMLGAAALEPEGQGEEVLITAGLVAQTEPDRDEVQRALYTLVDEFYLEQTDAGYRFANPLFRRWWLRYGEA